MDLIIKKPRFNKSFFVKGSDENSTRDDVCYIKINMTLFNITNFSLNEKLNNPIDRFEDKDLKFDIDKINLIQKNEINKTNGIVDKEVLINNNLKFFLNNHIKGLNKTNILKINSFIIKKITSALDTSNPNSKTIVNKNKYKYNNSSNNESASESLVKVKKVLNLESNITTNNFIITNLTNYTIVNDLKNSTTPNHKSHKQTEEKNNGKIKIGNASNSHSNNTNKPYIINKFILNKETISFSNESLLYKDKSNTRIICFYFYINNCY